MKSKYIAASLFLLVVGCGGDDGPNRAPVTVPDEATTAEDTSVTLNVLGNDSDPDGDELEVLIQPLPPEQGVVRLAGTGFEVEPAPDDNVVVSNVVTGNGSAPPPGPFAALAADIILLGGSNNCFSGNTFATQFPPPPYILPGC